MNTSAVMRPKSGTRLSVPTVHRRAAALMIALGLVACTQSPMPDVTIGLRNPTAPLGGTSRFDQARFAGDWTTVACLGSCAPTVRYLAATDGVYLRQVAGDETPFLMSAPGVLREMGGSQTLVVMWVDEGFRTAAVGDAGGRWAAILDRDSGSPDRIKAATEILDFNGWDVSKLRKVNG